MIFSRDRSGSRPTRGSAPAQPPPAGPGLAQLLRGGTRLPPEQDELLAKGFREGLDFYRSYNESRLELAFEAFDPEMRNALFELLFLLHVNDEGLARIAYTASRQDYSSGLGRPVETSEVVSLHVQGAPSGVKGLEGLSPTLQGPFRSFIRQQFGRDLPPAPPGQSCQVLCLQSIGSIGTIGHKSRASDLDLQVVYDPFPFVFDVEAWSDEALSTALRETHTWWQRRMLGKLGLKPADMKQPEVRREVSLQATRQVQQAFPHVYRALVIQKGSYQEVYDAKGSRLRRSLAAEMMNLIWFHNRIAQAREVQAREKLLRRRFGLIQKYLGEKYPTAEIYLFAMPIESYRAGKYASSLEFKESSGSAYELILNYDTLMPGIQFLPTLPTHFLLPDAVNNQPRVYEHLMKQVAFRQLGQFDAVLPMLVDLGATPELDADYVMRHGRAVYWEAFKASSGNLPKATLNLHRYEMLLDARLRKTIIQMIKHPECLDGLISGKGGNGRNFEADGVPARALLDMENDHPHLRFDPWWLRFKALKVAFGEPQGVEGLAPAEREEVSRILDLAFALHVRISDVFTKPGDRRAFETHRERVLLDFLQQAFPPRTGKRTFIEHIFAGDVSAVNAFEEQLRTVFRKSLTRVQEKMPRAEENLFAREDDEVRLWKHYYEQNFEPRPNMVQRTIMHQLKYPRGRLQVGHYPGRGWQFKSLQRESRVGKRFDTFGILDHLPDEVVLVEGTAFLIGLTHCIINGYYGIVNKGTLKERRTVLELDSRHLDMGNWTDNNYACVRPDHIDRIMDRILEFFPYEHHEYTDYLHQDRRIKRVFLFLNLWKFGRLSILYRDNLSTWFCDEFDHPALHKQAEAYHKAPGKLFAAPELHETLDRFLVDKRLYVNEVELATWVNPNSVTTPHSATSFVQKEKELAEAFHDTIVGHQPNTGG